MLSLTLSNAVCIAPFVVFRNQSDANVCKNESPISVHPPLCLEPPCFPYAHSSMLPPENRGKGKIFSHNACHVRLLGFLEDPRCANRSKKTTLRHVHPHQNAAERTHTHTQHTNPTLWDFSERWRLGSDRTAAGHPKLL